MDFTRGQIDFIHDLVKKARGEVLSRVVLLEKETVAHETTWEHPDSLPIAPPVFIDDEYEDDFDDISGLTGPYNRYADNLVMSAADGYLTLGGNLTSSPGHVYAGRAGGPLLPPDKDWRVEIVVTEGSVSGTWKRSGIGAAPGAMADNINWDTTGKAWCGTQVSTSYKRVYGSGSTYAYATLSSDPSVADPVTCRIAHEAATHTFRFYYRRPSVDDNNWQLVHTDVNPAGYDWTQNWDFGPLSGKSGTLTWTSEFSRMEWSYPVDGAPGDYAFIPLTAIPGWTLNHLYIRKPSGGYHEVVPEEGMVVFCRDDSLLYRWDGTAWVVYDHAMDGLMHQALAGAENDLVELDAAGKVQSSGTSVQDLKDYTDAAIAADVHDLDDPARHGGVAGTTDNFLSLNADGLPKDSGSRAADFEDAGAAAALQALIHAWLSGLLPRRPPLRLEQAAKPTVAQIAGQGLVIWKDTGDNREYLCWSNGTDTFAVEGT